MYALETWYLLVVQEEDLLLVEEEEHLLLLEEEEDLLLLQEEDLILQEDEMYFQRTFLRKNDFENDVIFLKIYDF